MGKLKPRIYGWRLAAGIVLWLAVIGLALTFTQQLLNAGEITQLMVANGLLVPAWAGLALGFWRGSQGARLLAIFPALGLFVAALGYFALSGLCTALAVGTPLLEPGAVDALSCSSREPRNIASWAGTAILAGSGLVVVLGVLLPGSHAGPPRPRPGGGGG